MKLSRPPSSFKQQLSQCLESISASRGHYPSEHPLFNQHKFRILFRHRLWSAHVESRTTDTRSSRISGGDVTEMRDPMESGPVINVRQPIVWQILRSLICEGNMDLSLQMQRYALTYQPTDGISQKFSSGNAKLPRLVLSTDLEGIYPSPADSILQCQTRAMNGRTDLWSMAAGFVH